MKKNEDVKQQLDDYAKGCAWNDFYEGGGKVADYNRYNEIKNDLKEKENQLENNGRD